MGTRRITQGGNMSVRGEVEWITESIVDLVGATENHERRIRDWLDGLVYNVRNETRREILNMVETDMKASVASVEAIRWVS